MPEEVAIEAAIKGLRIGTFTRHVTREKPSTMKELYNKFESTVEPTQAEQPIPKQQATPKR